MYLQTTSITNHSFSPSNSSSFAHFSTPYMYQPVISQLQRLELSSKTRSGCCNSTKRVSRSISSLRICGGLVRERSGGSQGVHDNGYFYSPMNQFERLELSSKLDTGFCNSSKRVSRSRISMKNHGGLVSVRCGGSEEVHDDGYYMRRCVELARKAIGCTSPNPMVGCVIVKDGKIVGEGFHPKAGQPHAEVFALRDAGDLAENATAYVTLEPCNHYGRTPPCTEALIKAKVKKVVVGMVDPNPIVASKGVKRLRDAGIEVTVSVEEDLCKKMIEAYIHKMLTGNPFVTLRYSISVDGQLLNQLGEIAMESGGYYSQLLQEYDAVVYSSALLKEKFFPASKEPGANQPLQVVLAKCPVPPIQISDLTNSKVMIVTEEETAVGPEIAQNGIETVVSDSRKLTAILEHCKRQGLCSVLLDLRGDPADFEEILREGFEQNLFQKVVAEVLPIWGRSQEETWKYMGQMLPLKNLTSRVSGKSILLEGYFDDSGRTSGHLY